MEEVQQPGYGICQLVLTIAVAPITLYVLHKNVLELREHAREQQRTEAKEFEKEDVEIVNPLG